MPLSIFYSCTAQFVSDLVGNPEDWFSHNEAQISDLSPTEIPTAGSAPVIAPDNKRLTMESDQEKPEVKAVPRVPKGKARYKSIKKMSHIMFKPAFCICDSKGVDQLHSNHLADQCLCFRYKVQFFYFLNSKFQAFSHLVWLYSPVCAEPETGFFQVMWLNKENIWF